jgi:hypothetical protein
MDYREIPADFEKAFDAFISVEMLEVSIILVDYLGFELTNQLARWSEILQSVL